MIQTTATMQNGSRTHVTFDRLPDHCPRCHAGIQALNFDVAHVAGGLDGRLEMLFRCPRERCQSLFISRYAGVNGINGLYYGYQGSHPFDPIEAEYPEHVAKVSPQFCKIANEAQHAEAKGWKLIVGPGYRKALEFLVKDYLCQSRPKDAERIKATQLGPCIANFLDNEKIKATASRAAWLGNDEVHYTRKWEDKDLEDLKTLITLTVHWIEMEEMTASVVKEMPEGKK